MRVLNPNDRIPSIEDISQSLNGHSSRNAKKAKDQISDHLHQKAFNNSFLANIISIESNGKIIAANRAAEKLLGYPGKGLLSKNFDDIFTSSDGHVKRMLNHRGVAGHVICNITAIKKNGKKLPCQIDR